MQQITSEKLSCFELELNQFNFRDIPVGSLIGSHMNLDFIYGHYNPKDYLKEMATSFYIKHIPSRHINGFEVKKHQNSKGLPIHTFLSDRRHLFNMSYPIFEELGPENVFCLIKNEKVLRQFKTKPVHFAFFDELPTYDYKIWHKEFKQLWKNIVKTVDHFIARNNIHKNYKLRLKNNLLGETRFIIAFEKLLDFLKPQYVLTEYDRFAFTSSLISSANKNHIQTFSMVHGVPGNSIGFTPLVANKVFVWGDRQRQTFIKYGVKVDKICVTGATQLVKETIGNKEQLKERLGLPNKIRVIVLATNPVKAELRLKLYQLFCDAFRYLPKDQYYGLIRLHPSEEKSFYENIDKPSNILFGDANVISFENTFAVADMVCNYNSAFAIDTIVRGLPLITINVDDKHLGQAKDYIEYGKLPQATSSTELVNIITDYFGKSNANELMKKVNAYAKAYCAATGKLAVENMLKCIKDDTHQKIN